MQVFCLKHPKQYQHPEFYSLIGLIDNPTIVSMVFVSPRMPCRFGPGAPLTYFNDKGGGGLSDFFWVYERRKDFFGS